MADRPQAASPSGDAEGPGVVVDDVAVAAYEIPTDRPEGDGTLAWSSTVMVVVHVRAGPVVGLGWTYASRAAATLVAEKLARVVRDADVMDVPAANLAMRRACRNVGSVGLAACAISALDVALWDAKARLLGISLVGLLGRARAEVPVYGSGGFTTYDDATTRDQLEWWVGELGLPRVKIKIGESHGADERRDRHRVALAREVVGDDVELYVDANGAYGRKQAVRLGREMAREQSVVWFEEPVSSDDLVGLREVRDGCEADVAAGEYGWSPWYYAPMLGAGAVDCVQVDVSRCGGITDWLAVAHTAAAHQLDVSGHCAPNLHAAVASAVPNLRHLEYFHDHVRIEQMLLEGTSQPTDGALHPDPGSPGHGLTFKVRDAEPYRVA